MALDTGIDWDNIDWNDHTTVSNTLSSVIEFLEKNLKVQQSGGVE